MNGIWVRIPRIIRTNPTIKINLYVEIFIVDVDFTFFIKRLKYVCFQTI
ncbi:hypothetical protein LCGC14_0936580 [marine sediment metagenome]|uniref:Uncharacterized protein n=1 Tax=marine sediment metagenome TaxID=412755 RepID=A0A0F9NQZ1_9ZZZZ